MTVAFCASRIKELWRDCRGPVLSITCHAIVTLLVMQYFHPSVTNGKASETDMNNSLRK